MCVHPVSAGSGDRDTEQASVLERPVGKASLGGRPWINTIASSKT
jgi:hypothetical protein